MVLSVDEKSQIQALDRTQPGLPMKKGRLGTMTHDYKRHGTTTLFAALNVLDGTVIGQNMQRHRHQEFIRFLNRVEREVPAGKTIHVILDNYAAHKKDKVRAWLDRHPRWTFHFTPTSCSWLNAVEGFFAKLTRRRLRHGVFHSVVDLQAAINRFVSEYNAADPRPFIWKADPDDIIAARNRGFQTLKSIPQTVRRWIRQPGMTITASSSGTKGLILAPHGRDAAVALGLLEQAGIAAEACADFETLQALIDDETLFVVATNEAMLPGQVQALAGRLREQPAWSDLPFVLLTRGADRSEPSSGSAELFALLGNVTFLERPFHPTTFISMARSAMKGRFGNTRLVRGSKSLMKAIEGFGQRCRPAVSDRGNWTCQLTH